MQMKCEREPGCPTTTSSQATESSMPLTMSSKFAHNNNNNNNNRKRIKAESDKSSRAIGLSQAHLNVQLRRATHCFNPGGAQRVIIQFTLGELHLTVRDK